MEDTRQFFRGKVFRFPVIAAQCTGTFPLSLRVTEENISVIFSWVSFGTFSIFFRLFNTINSLYITYYADQYYVEVEVFYEEKSRTLNAFDIASSIFISIGDFTCSYLMIYKRKEISRLINDLSSVIGEMLKETDPGNENAKELRKPFQVASQAFGFMFAMGNVVLTFHILFEVTRLFTLFYGNALRITYFVFLSVHFIMVMHFRLLAYHLMVTIVSLIRVAFTMLRWKVLQPFRKDLHGQVLAFQRRQAEKNVTWVLSNFDRLEKLLSDFHASFGLPLLYGLFSVLVSLLSVIFQCLVKVMAMANGSAEESSLYDTVLLLPLLSSFLITSYLLCNVATEMTTEAKECVWALRDFEQLHMLSDDLKKKLVLFYIAKVSKPPRISPCGMFHLGRHIFPTVSLRYDNITYFKIIIW